MGDQFRTEEDSLGEIEVPADAYWGAQTQRALENFPAPEHTFDRRFIEALGTVKKAAAETNRELGVLDAETADPIVAAAEEVIAGEHDDQFVVTVFQTGSGTSANMNANEVIANRAAELRGDARGERTIHPNDHVNAGQSSNDVIPTATHVAARVAIETELRPALDRLAEVLGEKERAFADVVKTGRTHLQDATPVTLGQEFGGYRTQIEHGQERIAAASEELSELALGGTAVGTGLNTHEEFPERAIDRIVEETGLEFREAENHFEAQAAHDALGAAHGAIRTVAGSLTKIANDLRLLASGPRTGIGELDQPENQPGSSIMPGKVNPVVAEAVNQVHARVVGNDATVEAGASAGQLELNLYKPVLADAVLESVELLADASERFAEKFVAKLEADREGAAAQVEQSMALATALAPTIGYDEAATIAKTALEDEKTIREVAVEEGYLTAERAEELLDPSRMTERGLLE
ncbi:aspartate ammonia-lyase [Halobacteriales archaeon QH_10_67_13]|nr:MAG: aspartate ammonia-lyase [Halobacteriales archaeon QH_10_67_13]